MTRTPWTLTPALVAGLLALTVLVAGTGPAQAAPGDLVTAETSCVDGSATVTFTNIADQFVQVSYGADLESLDDDVSLAPGGSAAVTGDGTSLTYLPGNESETSDSGTIDLAEVCSVESTSQAAETSVSCDDRGIVTVTFTNQAGTIVSILYGDLEEVDEDGGFSLEPGASESVQTERQRLDYITYSSESDGIGVENQIDLSDACVSEDDVDDTADSIAGPAHPTLAPAAGVA